MESACYMQRSETLWLLFCCKSLNQLSCWEVIPLQRREGIGFLAHVMYSSPPLGEMSIIIIHYGLCGSMLNLGDLNPWDQSCISVEDKHEFQEGSHQARNYKRYLPLSLKLGERGRNEKEHSGWRG